MKVFGFHITRKDWHAEAEQLHERVTYLVGEKRRSEAIMQQPEVMVAYLAANAPTPRSGRKGKR